MPNLNVTYCIYVPMPNNVYNFFFKRTEDEKQDEMITNVNDIIEASLKSFLDGETKLYPRNICPKNAFTYKNKELSQYKPRFKVEKTK